MPDNPYKLNSRNFMGNPILFIIIFSFILFVVSFLFEFFTEIIEIRYGIKLKYKNEIHQNSFTYQLILSCFLAPLIETYFFQAAPYNILIKKGAGNLVIILISSFIFGLIHTTSFAYMVYGFLAGIVLITAYIYWEGKKPSKYVIVCTIHLLHNLLVLLGNLFTD